MQRDLLARGVLAAEDPSPPMTLALLLLLREEVGYKVVVVPVAALGALDYGQDALRGALLLRGVDFLHAQNKFNSDADPVARHSFQPRQLGSQLGKVG